MGWRDIHVPFESLQGKTIIAIDGLVDGGNQVIFTCDDGKRYMMMHEQDCCEHVEIIDVCGDYFDLLGTPILQAEERTNEPDNPASTTLPWQDCASLWTFYSLSTIKGYVDIRWYGSSNGYYSMGVSFIEVVS